MDNTNLGRHISGQFNQDLEHVRNQVLAMGGMVETQLEQALEAVAATDKELAEAVIAGDVKVNQLEVAIDEEATQIIAKRQPTAVDLRLVMAIAKTSADLERIGDMAERIAKTALEDYSSKQKPLLLNVAAMGNHVLAMLREVLDAFARMDVDTAWKVHREDEKVDMQYEGFIRQMVTYMMEDPTSIPKVMEVMTAIRCLERVGDRCKNIAEYVIYFVKGKDVRHTDAESVAKLLK